MTGRFYRSDKSRHIPGSGLGLSLVSAILALHHARLEITQSRVHDTLPGATMSIVFPPGSVVTPGN